MMRSVLLPLIAVVASACIAKPSKLHVFPLSHDVTQSSVWGLNFTQPTERTQQLTPLFDPQEPTGGVALDTREKFLFTANAQGVYSCIRLSDRSTLWRKVDVDPLTMPPYFVPKETIRSPKDLVIEGTQNGHIFAVDAETGETMWTYDAGGEIAAAPSLAEGRLLALNARNQLVALDALTGKWIWQYSRDFPVGLTIAGHSGITVKNGRAYVGFSDGFVVAVGLEDGLLVWSRPITLASQGFADADATPVLAGGRLYAASVHDGVHAINANTGEVIWQLRIPNVLRIAASRGYVYAVSTTKLTALDADSGKTVWTFAYPPAIVSTPVVYRGYVTFGARPHGLYVLDAQKGQLVQHFYPGGVSSEIAHEKGAIAFMSEGSMVYYMRYGEPNGVSIAAKKRFQGL
jgi:outer membrane protein assembly factor BamB